VTKKKERGQSIYHKALEIDYPNERDRQRFRQAQVAGELPQNAHIGGLIEIHGEGGKGVNWTSGCVALTNKNMDAVFKLAKIGTPVTIVGALDGGAVLEKMAAANSDLKNQK
jgi:murein L,D-transpeptidase YafK